MKWTLVTGAAKKLGKEIALELAKSGRNIVVHYRNSQKEAEELVKKLRGLEVHAETICGDFSTSASTEQFISAYLKRFSETETLVCNVGNYILGSTLETSITDWQDILQTNLLTPLALIQALAPSLKRHKGQIINIGMVGCKEVRASTHASAYNTSKTALWMATSSLAKELAPDGVRVNMVSPGYLEESIDLPEKPSALPMGRLATFQEVAHAVAFLLDPRSSYITGQNLEVAGALKL